MLILMGSEAGCIKPWQWERERERETVKQVFGRFKEFILNIWLLSLRLDVGLTQLRDYINS